MVNMYRKTPTKEYILCAAIWLKDGIKHAYVSNTKTGMIFCGHRHDDCFAQIYSKDKPNYNIEMGFLTSLNRFVNREEAAIIATKSNQLEVDTDLLFSEHLY